MTRLKKVAVLAVVGIFILMLSPSRASADFIPAFTGYSRMDDFPTSTGVVNFAVYDNSGGGNWATTLGVPATAVAGGGAIDTAASFVYFYQVVNQGAASLSAFYVSSGTSPYTSAGYLSATVFTDADGAVGPVANQYLGANPAVAPSEPDESDMVPNQSGVAAPGFAGGDVVAVAPSAASTGGAPDGFAKFFFTPPNVLPAVGYTTVLFLTSNSQPLYAEANIRDGTISDGAVPVQAPEPSALMLSLVGIMGLGGSYGWRRWRGQPAA
jgi:hypothetical protein